MTPCDIPIIDYDENGNEVKRYECPYNAQGGDDCRNYCGLGVDE